MKRFFLTVLAVVVAQAILGGLFLLGLTGLMGAAMLGSSGKAAQVPAAGYLIQEIPSELPEFVPEPSMPFPPKPTSHTDILENLEKAAADDRITGVILKIQMPQTGWGKLQEIRERIHQVRAAGKEVIAYATVATNKNLYLASACDSIFIHPRGYLLLSGLSAERVYARRLLDKLGVRAQISKIDEYKAMAEMFLREDMSDAARENATWLLEDLYAEFIDTLARERDVTPERVREWLSICQFDPLEAVEQGIVDNRLFWEELEERYAHGRGDEWFVDGRSYLEVSRSRVGLGGERVAVIHGQGSIVAGENGWVFPLGGTMGDETMVQALEDATEDRSIKAILLRLDTGGGLSSASDRIGRAVAEAARKKPLVVSMVDVTASGGYMISYRCSTLVALPGSIVGSIGSINMRANMAGLFEKLGLTVDRETIGPHATMMSGLASMSSEEFARLEKLHWREYEEWVTGIAEQRGMTPEEVNAIARGQVFTGRQALANGLVDALGGIDRALELLKDQAGIAADDDLSFLHLPKEKSMIEKLLEGDFAGAARTLVALRDPQPLDQTAAFWRQSLSPDDALALTWWRF